MNLSTKLTVFKIILTIIVIVLLIFPFDAIGISIPVIRTITDIDLKYVIAGILFVITSFIGLLSKYLVKKNSPTMDTWMILNDISDRILINSVLVIFASEGIISSIVPVIIVIRDIIINTVAINTSLTAKVITISTEKIRTTSLMIGIALLFFGNFPFVYFNIHIDLLFVYFATIMSLVSVIEYYHLNKKNIFMNS